MTQEKACFLSPTDISAVRMKCKKCGAASVIPVDKLGSSEKVSAMLSHPCPCCGAESGFKFNTTEINGISSFLALLAMVPELMRGRDVEVGLQVECQE